MWEQCRKGNNCKVFVVNLLVVTGLKGWQRNTHVLNEQSLFDACGGMGRRGMYCGGIIRFSGGTGAESVVTNRV